MEKTVSATDPESGLFVKGEHERQFAYEAHTMCDRHGVVLAVNVTSGNIHDSVAWDGVYDKAQEKFELKYVTMDAAYKTPWIAKKILDGGQIPILPYIRPKGKKDRFKPWEYSFDEAADIVTCPMGQQLRHTTTSKEGKRIYRSTPKACRSCPCREQCGANEKGQKIVERHIWQECLDVAEQLRKTELGKDIYAMRKQSIERVFANGTENHAMRYTRHRGLARVTSWVRLKFAAMNLKKLAIWSGKSHAFSILLAAFFPYYKKNPVPA